MGGILYPTLEHAYQAAKTTERSFQMDIAACMSPGQAKRMGQSIPLRPDWEQYKIVIMDRLLRRKFKKGGKWADRLARTTGDLVEYNTWHDIFWGVCYCRTHAFEGENMLGQILTRIRDIDNA